MTDKGAALRGEVACGLALAGVGLAFTTAASRMPAFESGVPGPGLAPMLLGALLVALGLVAALLGAWRRSGAGEGGISIGAGKALGLLALAVAAFEPLGFAIATFLFLAGYLRLIGREPLARSLLFGALASAALWLLFVKALGVGLPAGLLRLA